MAVVFDLASKPPLGADSFTSACLRIFPNLSPVPTGTEMKGELIDRQIAGRTVIRVRCEPLVIEASVAKAKAVGLESSVKIVWQLAGSASVTCAGSSWRIVAGQVMAAPMAARYRLKTEPGYDALVLVFDRRLERGWMGDRWRGLEPPRRADSAARAAAASVASLVRDGQDDEGSKLVLDSVLGMMSWSLFRAHDGLARPDEEAGFLERVRRAFEPHVADADYSPDRLARDLSMSRRAMYATFTRFGTTPAAFLRDLRLERSRREITEGRTNKLSLTSIAMGNGFADSTTFSRAFRARYGVRPSALRAIS